MLAWVVDLKRAQVQLDGGDAMSLSGRITVIDQEEGAERGEMRNSWGWGPLDVIWAIGEGGSKG